MARTGVFRRIVVGVVGAAVVLFLAGLVSLYCAMTATYEVPGMCNDAGDENACRSCCYLQKTTVRWRDGKCSCLAGGLR